METLTARQQDILARLERFIGTSFIPIVVYDKGDMDILGLAEAGYLKLEQDGHKGNQRHVYSPNLDSSFFEAWDRLFVNTIRSKTNNVPQDGQIPP